MELSQKQRQAIECLRRKNFTPEEFFISETASKLNIINLPATIKEANVVIKNLMVVADKIQEIRNILDYPIKINSAFRCLELNRAVGSRDTSQHPKGQAVDFICPRFGNPAAIFYFLIEKKIQVDQCLMEGTWIHLSIKSKENRNIFAKMINGIYKPIKI